MDDHAQVDCTLCSGRSLTGRSLTDRSCTGGRCTVHRLLVHRAQLNRAQVYRPQMLTNIKMLSSVLSFFFKISLLKHDIFVLNDLISTLYCGFMHVALSTRVCLCVWLCLCEVGVRCYKVHLLCGGIVRLMSLLQLTVNRYASQLRLTYVHIQSVILFASIPLLHISHHNLQYDSCACILL